MQDVGQRRLSPCKRDALPAELTALAPEISDFSVFINPDTLAVKGTAGEQAEANGTRSPEIVPKSVPEPFRSRWQNAIQRGFALSPRHVCEIFDMSRGAVHNALTTGELNGFRLGNLWRVRPENIPLGLIEYWVALKQGYQVPEKTALPEGELVYFITGARDYVKIGFTTNLAKRVKALQIGCPEEIELLAYARGGRTLEHDYHYKFAAWRRAGEWFRLSQPIRAEIARLRKSDAPK